MYVCKTELKLVYPLSDKYPKQYGVPYELKTEQLHEY